jgi:hypothetical protein
MKTVICLIFATILISSCGNKEDSTSSEKAPIIVLTPEEATQAKSEYLALVDSLNITQEQEEAVFQYLIKMKLLTSCGTRTGCDGPCPEGQGCKELNRGNCACAVKE